MVGNLISLLLVIGLMVLFAWLTVRAVRSRKRWVKIAGGLAAGLLTVLLAAITFFGAKGFTGRYFTNTPAPPDLTVEGTPDQIARGEYLVNTACISCHGAIDSNGLPNGQHPLNGGFNLPEAEGFGFVGDMVAENLTPGGKLAGYSDGELFNALRHSVSQNGHKLGIMDFTPFKELSDQDTLAVIAYLRSLPPATQPLQTGDRVSFLGLVMSGAGLLGVAPQAATGVVTAPPQGATAEYGRYVATFSDCRGCHGPDMTGAEATAVRDAVPNPRPLVSTMTQEQFVEMMRTGIRPGNNPFPPTMPWEIASRLTDQDLAALYLYLTAPVE